MTRPIRFGLATFYNRVYTPTQQDWKEKVLQIENLGYSSIFIPDHFGTFDPQWEPIATMAAISAITKKINVGTSVLSIDYRHPAILALASSTIHMISNGRHELGIGAGWLKEEYKQLGIPFHPPKTRLERFEEAVQIIQSMWNDDVTNVNGNHFQVMDLPRSTPMQKEERPRLMIGGGGSRMMRLAGKYADIVNITRGAKEHFTEATLETLQQKVERVKSGAHSVSRDPDDIEFSVWIPRVVVTDEPSKELEKLEKEFKYPVDDIRKSTSILVGTPDEVKSRLMEYANIGVTYYLGAFSSFDQVKLFGESVIKPLS
jgi:probable F420-dependent oxidoreductase